MPTIKEWKEICKTEAQTDSSVLLHGMDQMSGRFNDWAKTHKLDLDDPEILRAILLSLLLANELTDQVAKYEQLLSVDGYKEILQLGLARWGKIFFEKLEMVVSE